MNIPVRKMKATEYRRLAFAGKPPAINTIKRLILARELPGEVLGGHYYVHVDEHGQPVQSAKPSPSTGNALADQIIREYQS